MTAMRAAFAAILCSLILAAGCHRRPPVDFHEAYIWQRLWTSAVVSAVAAQQSDFAGWRVLGLQLVGSDVIETRPDLAALASPGKPVRLVVRIDGARLPLAAPALLARLSPLIARWRSAGLDLTGIEIDHDCATSALADYASWLQQLRSGLPGELRLSITALPSWLDSPALDQLLAAVDDSVLQVHAVERPDRSLFDGNKARQWTLAFARRTQHPFAVALPAYGVRVDTDAQGRVSAVDAEADIERSGAGGRELRADPREVASFLRQLASDRPENLSGYLWFRLPVAGDRRGWSAAMLGAVIAASPLESRFVVSSTRNAGGSVDLAIRNLGTLDAPPPAVDLPAHCRLGDALGRYRLQSTPAGLRLAPDADAWLPVGETMAIGWVRCAQTLEREWVIR